ncbi:MAG: triose-phosphate isomerase [Spirochaetales bacterium]|nr:triose-phosphate isomerase [Spirochaetales bacterium]
MRKLFIAGNWKMNKTVGDAVTLARRLVASLGQCSHKVMIAPPFTALSAVAEVIGNSPILLGAQNMANEEHGAHTGEVSVLMLLDIGVETVILGHSERRHVYGEPDELVNDKLKLAISHGLDSILCVGEKLDEREAGNAEGVVDDQVRLGLAGVNADELSRVTIAYEPVWAIGTGKTATPQDADSMHAHIRTVLTSLYSPEIASNMTIQYGGSVKPSNASSLLGMENIDGALVGGASLEEDTFVPIALYDK